MGILADLIGTNRKLLEATLLKVRQLEQRLDERGEADASEAGVQAPDRRAAG
jgi:hypothetical protein